MGSMIQSISTNAIGRCPPGRQICLTRSSWLLKPILNFITHLKRNKMILVKFPRDGGRESVIEGLVESLIDTIYLLEPF